MATGWTISPYPGQTYFEFFESFHYLNGPLAKGARAWLVFLPVTMKPVAFDASIPLKGKVGSWVETRLVVLPAYRDQGLGKALSEWLGEYHLARSERFYSTTRNARVGHARNVSSLW